MGLRRQVSTARVYSVDRQSRNWALSWGLLTAVVLMLCCISNVTQARIADITASTTFLSTQLAIAEKQIGYRQANFDKIYAQANQAYDAGEIHLAYRLWQGIAEQDHADAAFKLGMLHDRGDGVEHDASIAAHWYLRAALVGHHYAQHNLGVAYANGDGVEIDIRAAISWWQRAAEQGNVDSQYNLGIVYALGTHGITQNTEMAESWWRKAAQGGDPMAQYNLGALYANGTNGVRNVCEAVLWLEKSAKNGITQAKDIMDVVKKESGYSACQKQVQSSMVNGLLPH